MKKLSLIGACAVILIFVAGVGTPVAAPVEQGLIEYVCPPGRVPLAYLFYDCDTVPEDSSAGAWEIYEPTQNSTWHSDGERLFIEAYPEGAAAFYRVEESLATAEYSYIEVAAKLTRFKTQPLIPLIWLGFGISDGVKLALVWTSLPSRGQVAVNWLDQQYGTHLSDEGVTNWFQLNTYRLVVDKSHPDPARHVADVYVNDTGVLSVPYSELTDFPGNLPGLPETPHLFAFGVNWSDTEWDQLMYAACGPTYTAAITAILEFFDQSVEEGSLVGVGTGKAKAMRNMIEAAGDPIGAGDIAGACQRLQQAYFRTDGESPPPDFVTGEAAGELAEMIQALMTSLGCE